MLILLYLTFEHFIIDNAQITKKKKNFTEILVLTRNNK